MNTTAYPVDITVSTPKESSRMWALLFVLFGIKSFVLIIQYIVAFIWGIGVFAVFFISQLVVLFTGSYPEGMYRFIARFISWSNQVNGWLNGLTDQFPSFTPSDELYPIETTIPRPERSSRGWAALTIFLLKFLALIPHFIVLYVLGVVQLVLVFVANVIILVTAEFPEGLVGFVVGVMRWQTRVTSFALGLVDEYPPFTLQ